jgi:hypothetical protein
MEGLAEGKFGSNVPGSCLRAISHTGFSGLLSTAWRLVERWNCRLRSGVRHEA